MRRVLALNLSLSRSYSMAILKGLQWLAITYLFSLSYAYTWALVLTHFGLLPAEILKNILFRFFRRCDLPFELRVFEAPEDSSKLRARAITHVKQVVSG
jgi:hypothetical protein